MNTTQASPQSKAAEESGEGDPGLHDNANSSSFEFPKGGDRGMSKVAVSTVMPPKLGPSKWDDAEKWLSSSLYSGKIKIVALHGHNCANFSKQSSSSSSSREAAAVMPANSYSAPHVFRDNASIPLLGGHEAFHSMKNGLSSVDGARREADLHQQAMRAEVEGRCNVCAGEANSFAFPAPPSKARSINNFDFFSLQEDPSDMKELSISHEILNDDKPSEPPPWGRAPSFVMPDSTMRSVSMRDMGTEMTPIASQEPSRTGTPIQATTPLMRSPVSSGSSTPWRAAPAPSRLQAPDSSIQPPEDNTSNPETDGTVLETCRNELHVKTGRDVQTLGVQLGKISIVAWASKEEEDVDSSKLLKNIDLEEVKKNVLEARATAWEEAEQAKYAARFEREEAKIQAWENHEKAKAEAEMRRIEVKIEKIRSHAHEKLMNKLAAAKRRAEERRAGAEARRSEQAAKTLIISDRIRRTGRVPSPMLGCAFCQ